MLMVKFWETTTKMQASKHQTHKDGAVNPTCKGLMAKFWKSPVHTVQITIQIHTFLGETRTIMTMTTEGTLQQVLADNPLEETNTSCTLINPIQFQRLWVQPAERSTVPC